MALTLKDNICVFFTQTSEILHRFERVRALLPFEKGQGHFYGDLPCYRIQLNTYGHNITAEI